MRKGPCCHTRKAAGIKQCKDNTQCRVGSSGKGPKRKPFLTHRTALKLIGATITCRWGSRRAGYLAGPHQFGKGDENSRAGEPNQTHNVPSSKRLSDIPPTLDPPAKAPIQGIDETASLPSPCGIRCKKQLPLCRRVVGKDWDFAMECYH